MRDHSTIVRDAGVAEIVAKLGVESEHTVRAWMGRNRIPAEQWAPMAEAGFATLEELAAMIPARARNRAA